MGPRFTPRLAMTYELQTANGYRYLDTAPSQPEKPTLLLLHGLFGALSNFQDLIGAFSGQFRILVPIMPIYDRSEVKATVSGLSEYIRGFIEWQNLSDLTLLGNSLGGHIALVYTLAHPQRVKRLILTGSSGLFESGMGSSFPRRGSRSYVEERVSYTFYDPAMATDALIEEVMGIINDNMAALRILQFARSAQNHNMRDDIGKISQPVLLIWGLNDNITPPYVAHEFERLLPNTTLRFIDRCGHAPMMEQPAVFNRYVNEWLTNR